MIAEESKYTLRNGLLEEVPPRNWMKLRSKQKLLNFSDLPPAQQLEAKEMARRANGLVKRVNEVAALGRQLKSERQK